MASGKVDYHQWINTFLLALLAITGNRYLKTIDDSIELGHKLEIRVSVLEDMRGGNMPKPTAMNRIEAILPSDTKIKNEEE